MFIGESRCRKVEPSSAKEVPRKLGGGATLIIIIRVIEDSTQRQKHLFLEMENKPPGRKTPSFNIYLANIY